MNIEMRPRIELGNLLDFIAEEKGVSYAVAEDMLAVAYFEGAHISCDNTDYWCSDVVAYLKLNKIDSVEVYQDS